MFGLYKEDVEERLPVKVKWLVPVLLPNTPSRPITVGAATNIQRQEFPAELKIEDDPMYLEFVNNGGFSKEEEVNAVLRKTFFDSLVHSEEGARLLQERVSEFNSFKETRVKESNERATIIRKLISDEEYKKLAAEENDVAAMEGLPIDASSILESIKMNKAKEYSIIYKRIAKEVAKNDSGKYQTVDTASQ